MEMTQKWIDRYNKKCAEFLFPELVDVDDAEIWGINTLLIESNQSKYEILNNRRSNIFMSIDLKFRSDWNWIMEVVDKIESLEDKQFYMEWIWLNKTNVGLYQRETNSGSTLWEYIARFSDSKTKKQAVIQAIDQFIDWYNKHKEL